MNWLAELIGKKRVKQLGLPMAILTILLAGMGALFLQFGPVFLDHKLKEGNQLPLKREPSKIDSLEVKKLELEIKLLNKLNDVKNQELAIPKLNFPDLNKSYTKNIKTKTVKQTQSTPHGSKVNIANKVSPTQQDNQVELKQIPREELSRNKSYPIPKDIKVILVFEEQVFELCGYQGFKAIVTKKTNGKAAIKIRSMDRSIPNRSFRGYDRIVPINQMVELWSNCSAAFKYESLASTKRIVISYLRS